MSQTPPPPEEEPPESPESPENRDTEPDSTDGAQPPSLQAVHAVNAPTVDEPAPPTEPRLHLHIVWLLLLVLVATTAVLQWFDKTTADPTQAQSDARPSPDLVNASQLTVWANQMGAGDDEPGQSLGQLRVLAEDEPINRVRLAIVRGEIEGGEAALAELGDIDTPNPMVRADMRKLRAIYTAEGSYTAAGRSRDADEPALRETDQQSLIDRHGWFGQLALGYEVDNAHRATALNEAWRTAQLMMGLILLAGLGLLAGLALLVLAIVLRSLGGLRFAYRRPHGWTQPLLEALALFLFVLLAGRGVSWLGGAMFGEQIAHIEGFVQLGAYALALLTPLWPLFRGYRWSQLRDALGWRRGRGFGREIGCGLVGYIAGLPIIAIGFIGTALLAHVSGRDASHPVSQPLVEGGIVAVLLIIFLAVIVAPLLEEALFRGGLYHHLRSYLRGGWGVLAAALTTGFLFAVIHPQGWLALPVLTAIGFVFAMIREWRGSLTACIVAHGVNNLLALMIALLFLR